MPLKALNSRGEIVLSWKVKEPEEIYYCPYCKGEMVFVNAKRKIRHFRHLSKCKYEYEQETLEHLLMKKVVYDWLNNLGLNADVEVKIGNHVADVVANDLVVEVQVSNITSEVAIDRLRTYSQNGYYTLFLFTPDKIEWRKWFVIRSAFRRKCLALYDRRLHYLDPYTKALGVYILRKKLEDNRLEGWRYAIERRWWYNINEYRKFKKYEIFDKYYNISFKLFYPIFS